MIGLKQLSKKYGYSEGHLRVLLCRPEFNQFRIPTNCYYTFEDSKNFHKVLKFIIKLKTRDYIILLALLFNTQIAWCQHYEPVMIYNQYGEPQVIIRGKITYNNYGLPKKYTSIGGYTK